MSVFLIFLQFSITFSFSILKINLNDNCGDPVILPDLKKGENGKEEAIEHSWPWHVNIFVEEIVNGKRFRVGHSSGTLISAEWVMTAALRLALVALEHPSKYRIWLGGHGETTPGELEMKVKRIRIEGYHMDSMTNDIAFLKLAEPVNFDMYKHIRPICIPEEGESLPEAHTVLFATGWGAKKKNEYQRWMTMENLGQVKMTLADIDQCQKQCEFEINPEQHFCTESWTEDGDGPYMGDIGGPIVYYNRNKGKWIQVGIITSTGPQELHHPGASYENKLFHVFTKVSTHLPFIERVLDESDEIIMPKEAYIKEKAVDQRRPEKTFDKMEPKSSAGIKSKLGVRKEKFCSRKTKFMCFGWLPNLIRMKKQNRKKSGNYKFQLD